MQQVIHPHTGQLMTVEQYMQQYPNALLNNPSYHPPLMICPHCSNRNMVLRARSSISVPPYFAHPRNFGYCPSQENREGIYRGYGIQNPDPNNAKILRDNFRHYWQYYFKKLKQLVPYLRKEEFTRLIDIASEERIWEYRNVEPYHIPYLLVTLADFPIQKPDAYYKPENCRQLYLRYWFNTHLNNYEEIFGNLRELSLCRASYKLEGKERIPMPKRLMKTLNISIDNDLLHQDVEDIPLAVKNWVNRYFEFRNWN